MEAATLQCRVKMHALEKEDVRKEQRGLRSFFGHCHQSSGYCSLIFDIKLQVSGSKRLKNFPAMGNMSFEICVGSLMSSMFSAATTRGSEPVLGLRVLTVSDSAEYIQINKDDYQGSGCEDKRG